MVTDVAVFAIFGGYCRCVQCANGKVGVDHVVGSQVVALEKFVYLVPYCQVIVLSWSSHG